MRVQSTSICRQPFHTWVFTSYSRVQLGLLYNAVTYLHKDLKVILKFGVHSEDAAGFWWFKYSSAKIWDPILFPRSFSLQATQLVPAATLAFHPMDRGNRRISGSAPRFTSAARRATIWLAPPRGCASLMGPGPARSPSVKVGGHFDLISALRHLRTDSLKLP